MNFCCCGGPGVPSCDPGPRPEDAYFTLILQGVVNEPPGPGVNIVHPGGTFGPVHLIIRAVDGCLAGGLSIGDYEQFDPGSPNYTFPPLSLQLQSYRWKPGTYTYRCQDIDTELGASLGIDYRLDWESTEILADGSRKWVYAMRDFQVLPEQFSFDPLDPLFFITAELGRGNIVFTIYEQPQPAQPYRDAGYSYLRDHVDGVVTVGGIQTIETDILDTDARGRVVEILEGSLQGQRARVLHCSTDGRMTFLQPLPEPIEAGTAIRILADEYMHRCHLDFRVDGALYQRTRPGEGQANVGQAERISYISHMHFYRPVNDNRWHAASALSCCTARMGGVIGLTRTDPPRPLEFVQGQDKGLLFQSGDWPTLTGHSVRFQIFAPGSHLIDGTVLVAGGGDGELVTQGIAVDVPGARVAKFHANAWRGGQVTDTEATAVAFRTNLTAASGTYTGMWLEIEGGRMDRQLQQIADYQVVDGVGVVTLQDRLSSSPPLGTRFRLLSSRDGYTWRVLRSGTSNPLLTGRAIVFPPDGSYTL